MPEVVALTEEGTEADGHGGGDGTLAVDDLVDGAGGDADGAGHGVLGDGHGFEILFEEDLAGGDSGFGGVWL